MKLRTRLFLSVGVLFVLFFTLASFLEGILIRKRLTASANRMKQEIVESSREKMLQSQKVVGMEIATNLGKINALLHRIDLSRYLEKSSVQESWYAVANLAVYYPWLNYLQYTLDGKLISLLIPSPQDLHPITYFSIDDSLYWIMVTKGSERLAYLALPIKIKELFPEGSPFLLTKGDDQHTIFFLLDPLILTQQSFSNPIENGKESEVAASVTLFQQKLLEAKSYLASKNPPLTSFENLQNWIRQTYQEVAFFHSTQNIPPPRFAKSIPDSVAAALTEEQKDSFIRFQETEDVALLTGAFIAAFRTGLFGQNPSQISLLTGLCTLLPGMEEEVALLTNELVYEESFFDDQSFANTYKEELATSSVSSSLVTMNFPAQDQFFLGNLLKSVQNDKTGYLTLGVSLESLFEAVAIGVGRTTLVSYKGDSLRVYTAEGKRSVQSPFLSAPIDEMGEEIGEVKIGDENYYYWHLRPYGDIGLDLFLFEKESEVFETVFKVHQEFVEMLNRLSWTMRAIAVLALFVALLLLEWVARRISRPISSLAEATHAIMEGHYEEVHLPSSKEDRKDEISILCHSFDLMVKGLQDREKVKAVLNKVVSKEIAKEILEHPATLGGEERVVTILFADIRGFTHMTEKMAPTEVISLLNTCMTKLSHIVDAHGGVIDKYVGDEVMALYGAPVAMKESTVAAIQSGIEMMMKIAEWNQERIRAGLAKVEIGIGINTGKVVAGNMGAENRLNYTVLGAQVNLAARLCSIAAPGEMLLSEEAYRLIEGEKAFVVEKKDPIKLKGFSQEITTYSVKQSK